MEQSKLDIWADRLAEESMPIFGHTVQKVAGTASSEQSSFSDLAVSILQDPSLTAQVLKLSNSLYYNPASKRIENVSRALMRLGFDSVRTICLSAALVETVLSTPHKERVALEIARAFHSAVQAKKMAVKRSLSQPEEVFVAALLSRIGQIAFWCSAGQMGDKLENAIKKGGKSETQTENDLLGFSLDRLTLKLAKRWKLSSLLESMMEGSASGDPRTQCISLGCQMAQASESGWSSTESRGVIRKVAEFLKISENEAAQGVQSAARTASEITDSLGAQKSSRLIPAPPESAVSDLEATGQADREYPEPDPQAQLKSLQNLSAIVMSGKGDINAVLSLVLDGIQNGIGMDRVLFALLTPNHQYLKGKFALGWDNDDFVDDFRMAVKGSRNIFSHALNCPNPIWVNDDPPPEIFELLTKEMSDLIGNGPFLIMSVRIKDTPLGIVYADRKPSGRELDAASFKSFSLFGQQANACLIALSS